MYLDFYGFTEKPFFITPNPRFIFFSKIHKEAFALLLYGINSRFGFIELTGEVGTGKTTVLRTLLGQLAEEKYRTALIFNPSLSASDLMRAVNREYGIPATSDNVAELLIELNRFLLQENAAGRMVVLVIDEAQNLTAAALEQIRMVSNLETDTEKLIQIILAGQPELRQLLQKPELRQISQRIALRYHLRPLSWEETKNYIVHRIAIAGGNGKITFTAAAIRWLYRYSRGTPRLINILCDRALLIGYTEDRKKITARIITLAFRDVMLKPSFHFSRTAWSVAAVMAIVIAVVLSAAPLGSWAPGGPPFLTAARSVPEATPHAPAPPTVQDEERRAAEFKEALGKEVSLLSDSKSALEAFNAVARCWHTPPVSRFGGKKVSLFKEVKQQARNRNLELTTFKGTLDELLRLDTPALIPLANGTEPGILVALTGEKGGKLTISPPLLGRHDLTAKELSSLWSGRAYIIWRNGRNLPVRIYPGATGAKVKKLQVLLREAGYSSAQENGLYDDRTVKLVKDFQVSRGRPATGITDSFTLIQLYGAVKGSSTPALAEKNKVGAL